VMLVFPQLKTGAVAQYPLARRRIAGGLINNLGDGSVVTHADSTPRLNRWELGFRDLTDAEADSLKNLFQAVEGRRGTFTFVDPAANLLAHSEELDKTCWTKGPMIQVANGIDDPLGGAHAMRLINAGQTEQALSQTLPAPAWFRYCMSVYARSASSSSLTLTRSATSDVHSRVFMPGSAWSRWVLSGALNTTSESVTFSVVLPPGGSVDVFGIQAEPQPASSAYKRTDSRNGVFPHARFDDDVLRLVSDGPDQHRCDLQIVARD
jgi:hypothetical protein